MDNIMKETLEKLKKMTEGCRDNMHEPDEQHVHGVVRGYFLDNAFGDDPKNNQGEFTIGIYRDGKIEWFNIATLVALARKAKLD